MRIAVDIGFGFVKAMNDQGTKVRFPSVITKRSDISLRGIVGGAGGDDDYSIIYWEENSNGRENEKKCYVGDSAITNGGTRRWGDKSEFNVEELKIFIATAVGLLNPNNKEVDLCVGLPMSYYLQKRDELIEAVKDINARVSYTGVSGIRNVKVKSIFCFPQGAGAYYSAIFEIDGKVKDYNLATASVGVIDIGYGTVDFLVMGKGRKGISIIDSLSGSLEEDGMIKVFQNIERAVSESDKVQREIGVIEIEKAILWFGSKLDFRREQINLEPYERVAYKEHGENISAKIKQKWGVDGDILSVIIISGGGGEDLFSTLSQKFEQAQLQEDSAFANCSGFLGAQARKMRKA